MQHRVTEGQTRLEKVEIRLSADGSALMGVSIRAHGCPTENVWPDTVSPHDPTNSEAFFAFLLACVMSKKQAMKEDEIVLEDAQAVALYSAKPDKKWCARMLIFGGAKKPAILGSFYTSGRPNGNPPLVYRLRAPFTVDIFSGGALTDDLMIAEKLLRVSFGRLKNKRQDTLFNVQIRRTKIHNLPAARCNRFIKRQEVEASILKAIESEKPIIWIYGEDGTGRSEALRHVLAESINQLPFEAIIWVDIKPDESVSGLGLPQVVAELSRELELPKLSPLGGNPDLSLTAKELSRKTMLIVLQHFEALDEPTVFHWLRSLQKTKVAVISSNSPRHSQMEWSSEVKVPHMSPVERQEFLELCLANRNREPFISESDRKILFEVSGSNPRRIAKIISYVRHGGNFCDITEPKFIGELVPTSFKRFGENSQKCLIALSLFPYGAYSEQLVEVTGLDNDEIQDALWPLGGFVEVCYGQSVRVPSRRILPDAGTSFWLREHHKGNSEFLEMKERWFAHFEKAAKNVGFCWDDVTKLRQLDLPGIMDTIRHVLRQSLVEQRYQTAITIGRDCRYWQYVRGEWMSEFSPIEVWTAAARATGNNEELFDALVYKFNIKSKQAIDSTKALTESNKLARELITLYKKVRLSKVRRGRYTHALSLWDMARGHSAAAVKRWKACLRERQEAHERSAMLRWLAVCLVRKGKNGEARTFFLRHLADVEGKYERSALMTHLNLTEIDLEEGNTTQAQQRLNDIRQRIVDLEDLSFCADFSWLLGSCLFKSGDQEALTALRTARELYERLGKDARVVKIDEILTMHPAAE